MPRMGGARLVEAMRARWPRLPVLFMSGYTDQELTTHGVLQLQAEFLHKPFRSEELLRRVRGLLDSTAPVAASAVP
jgi:two-component system, cell cycle sensor histidine kinase and response regulator CckA